MRIKGPDASKVDGRPVQQEQKKGGDKKHFADKKVNVVRPSPHKNLPDKHNTNFHGLNGGDGTQGGSELKRESREYAEKIRGLLEQGLNESHTYNIKHTYPLRSVQKAPASLEEKLQESTEAQRQNTINAEKPAEQSARSETKKLGAAGMSPDAHKKLDGLLDKFQRERLQPKKGLIPWLKTIFLPSSAAEQSTKIEQREIIKHAYTILQQGADKTNLITALLDNFDASKKTKLLDQALQLLGDVATRAELEKIPTESLKQPLGKALKPAILKSNFTFLLENALERVREQTPDFMRKAGTRAIDIEAPTINQEQLISPHHVAAALKAIARGAQCLEKTDLAKINSATNKEEMRAVAEDILASKNALQKTVLQGWAKMHGAFLKIEDHRKAEVLDAKGFITAASGSLLASSVPQELIGLVGGKGDGMNSPYAKISERLGIFFEVLTQG